MYIIEAKDDYWGHKPDGSSWISGTIDAVNRFETNFNVEMKDTGCLINGMRAILKIEYDALEDLRQDFDKDPYNLIPDKPNGEDVDVYNAVVFGWADDLNRNGTKNPFLT